MKLGKLIVDIEGIDLTEDDRELLSHPYIGGIILFSRNYSSIEQLINLIDNIKKIRSPSLIIYVDQEGGKVQRFKNELTRLPSVELIGIKYKHDPHEALDLSKELGWLISFELRCLGVDVNTMPVLDINYKRSNVMDKRCFAETPKIVTLLSEAFICGSNEVGISSICKHYPGHGYSKTDSHIELPIDNRDFKTIYNDDLMPYKKAIDLNLEGIMTSHVLYKNIDKFPPTISRKWLQILKNDLRYKGLIYSDDLSMSALEEFGEIEENVIKSIEAGCDCIFICNNREKVVNIVDNLIIDNDEKISNKIISLSNNKIDENLIKNKKRIRVIEKLKRISDKKQMEIGL